MALSLVVGSLVAENVKVTNMSSEAVYIDGGTDIGWSLGDSLTVYRGDRLQATLVITNISSISSACTILDQVGDLITVNIVSFDRKLDYPVAECVS